MLKEFQKQRRENQEIRRQVIVVLSDGQDNASHVEFDEVLELARRIGASIYIISLTKPSTLPPRMVNFQYLTRVAYSMKALAREVGGRIFQPTQASQLPQVYGAIASELANQYELGYVPSNLTRDGGYRRIAVRVTRDDASVRTRTGYFADGSGFLRHSIDPQD